MVENITLIKKFIKYLLYYRKKQILVIKLVITTSENN